MSREILTHRVQELRENHGQEWILATDGSFDPRSIGPAGLGVFVLSPSGVCWLFCGATETDRELEDWHGEEDHTNNTGELKAMQAAHLFIRYLQEVTGWQEARHEAPSQRLQDVQNVTVMGHEWSNPLPNPIKQELYDFILRALIEQNAGSGHRRISIAEANMKRRIVYDLEIAGLAAMATRHAANHLSLVSVLQTIRRQIRRKEEIYMQWTPGHSKHLGNEIADGLAFLGSQVTCFCPQWMKDTFKEVHRKATEIGTVEPKREFTPMQHSGWTGFRDILITTAEKVIGRGKQPVVGLPYSEESLREIRRKQRLLDEKNQWARLAMVVDEVKRRKKELNSMRSDFNAYRWRAKTEWANKTVLDLKKAEESHDVGGFYGILRETGLSVENTFSAKGRKFCLVNTVAAHLETRGQDQTADMGNFAERVPNVPTNHRLAWLPDGQEIRSTICQMRDSAPRTDEITKTLIVAGGQDLIDMAVSLIQALKQWEEVVADIEVYTLCKGKGPRSLPQNQRFIMFIAFVWVESGCQNFSKKAHKSRRSQFSHCQRMVWVQIETLCPGSGLGTHSLH